MMFITAISYNVKFFLDYHKLQYLLQILRTIENFPLQAAGGFNFQTALTLSLILELIELVGLNCPKNLAGYSISSSVPSFVR